MKRRHRLLIKRAAAGASTIAFVCLVAWVGGFDFNERGNDAALLVALCAVLGGYAAAYPFE